MYSYIVTSVEIKQKQQQQLNIITLMMAEKYYNDYDFFRLVLAQH